MLVDIGSSCPVLSSVLQNKSSAKLSKFYKKISVTAPLFSKTVSIHALSPQTYHCTLEDTITIFSLLHFTQVCVHRSSAKYMFLKIPQNSQEIVFTKLSWLWHGYYPDNDLKFLGTTFFIEHLQTTASDFSFIFLLINLDKLQLKMQMLLYATNYQYYAMLRKSTNFF